MTESTKQEPDYHVLLIGVDAYPDPYPLNGCVSDIDAIQRILLDGAKIPAERITRLVSPHPGGQHDTTVPGSPATLANIRAAFAALGSDRVKSNDRVFIYYAGHGSQLQVTAGARTSHREALVPVDYDAGPDPQQYQFLYDFELNALLGKIVAQTKAVAVILDCCNSSGATRAAPGAAGMTPRFIDFARDDRRKGSGTIPPAAAQGVVTSTRGIGAAENVDDCQVVAGCLSHESANEAVGTDGIKHGLLTRALMAALDGLSPAELRTVPWGRVWQKIRADIETENPAQHPWMSGSVARAVLAGPPVDGDIGFGIKKTNGSNQYQIDAGSLAGVTAGARLAVYGDQPFKFPPLNSEDDLTARVGVLLTVTKAARSTAKAEADGPAFELPAGARGRLVVPGEPERLRCAVIPEDQKLVAALKASKLVTVVPEGEALVRLEGRADGRWDLTDDVHGAREGSPALFSLTSKQLEWAAPVLEHYTRYAAPLRMANLCTDLPGALQVRLLATPASGISPEQAQVAEYPEVPRGAEFPYELTPATSFCFLVRNTSSQRLRVTLLNCSADGQVNNLGDQIIEPKGGYVFWLDNTLGSPFFNSPPDGATQGIDRAVAIGRTAVDKDLSYLLVNTGFAAIVKPGPATRHIGAAKQAGPPADLWTATETIIRTVAGGSG